MRPSSLCILVALLFCILSADVGSLCIIAAVDFVRGMRPFLSFPVAFLVFFTLYNNPRYGYIDDGERLAY